MVGDFDGTDRAALGSLLNLAFLLWKDFVPGGGHPLLGHQKDTAAHIDAQAAADTVFVDMDVHHIPSLPG